jgi:hypothetical protein
VNLSYQKVIDAIDEEITVFKKEIEKIKLIKMNRI